MTQAPTTVWNEIRITAEGIGITLYSESVSGPAIVEDETWFTFDELAALSPSEPLSLNLSEQSQTALDEQRQSANVGKIHQADTLEGKAEHLPENPSSQELLAYMGLDDMSDVEDVASQSASETLPEPGVFAEDENPPSWSEDNRLYVVGIPDKSANEYIVEETASWQPDSTVATANPSCDPDKPVIETVYVDDYMWGAVERHLSPTDPFRIDEEDIYAFPASRLSWD